MVCLILGYALENANTSLPVFKATPLLLRLEDELEFARDESNWPFFA
jgi:hypothetical protein